jgi:hypothetical protein
VLDEIKDRADGKERRLPKTVHGLMESVPDGYYSVSYVNVREIAALLTKEFELIEEDGAEGWGWVQPFPVEDETMQLLLGKVMRAVYQFGMAMQPLGANYSVEVMRYRDRTLTVREIW